MIRKIIGGILFFFTGSVTALLSFLINNEIIEDPHDFIAKHILDTAHHLSGASLAFGAAYLLSHGIVKLVLVEEVWRDRMWAYIGLIVVTGLFVIYQLYRLLFVGFSIGLTLLTVFDLIIIYLTQVEYRRQTTRMRPPAD